MLKEGGRPYDLGGRIDSVVYEATTFALDTARVAGIPVGLASPVDTLVAMTPPVFSEDWIARTGRRGRIEGHYASR